MSSQLSFSNLSPEDGGGQEKYAHFFQVGIDILSSYWDQEKGMGQGKRRL
jgi:hypothetical protein